MKTTAALSIVKPGSPALLLMDFQGFVLDNFLSPATARDVVGRARQLLDAARLAALPVIHVTVAFRRGYPEIDPHNALFSRLKESGLVTPGSEGIRIHADLTPLDTEAVVVKHRVGPFIGTDLDLLLRAGGIRTLILAGVTTAGVVLSTARHAFDLDYTLAVAADGCADPDEEIHMLLIDKVLPQHATVSATEDIARALQTS
jgi:nicotinamidase-related amidase